MNIIKFLRASLIFLLGFLSANFFGFYLVYGFENPFIGNFSKDLSFPLGFLNYSKNAPFDFVKENQIEIYPDKIIINVENASIARYAPTGSMKPLLDENSNGLRIIPQSEKDIHLGDIITFEQDGNLIVHRVINKSRDSEGVYFITKGDNNSVSDGKIRFKDIKYITIGIIW